MNLLDSVWWHGPYSVLSLLISLCIAPFFWVHAHNKQLDRDGDQLFKGLILLIFWFTFNTVFNPLFLLPVDQMPLVEGIKMSAILIFLSLFLGYLFGEAIGRISYVTLSYYLGEETVDNLAAYFESRFKGFPFI